MKTTLPTTTYTKLLHEISTLYERTRTAVVRAYWEIGKRIVEVEQQGEDSAEYGTRLIERLSRDLSKKYGSGFSYRNLHRMKNFYLKNRILPAPAKLSWTHQVELMKVEDTALRQKLARRAVREGLSTREVRALVQAEKEGFEAQWKPVRSQEKTTDTLRIVRSRVHVFSRVPATDFKAAKGKAVIDCGFRIWRIVPKKDVRARIGTPTFTYPATVISVIDGDTLWARIDCGFGTLITEKLRLASINTPELTTTPGRAAKRFVEKRIPTGTLIVIRTSTSGKYDRYLADILYLPGETNVEKIVKDGKYLNQELLDQGYAGMV